MVAVAKVLALLALLLASLGGAEGHAFLNTRPRTELQELAVVEVEEALLSELSGLSDMVRLAAIEEELRGMFLALPKDAVHGSLEPFTVRYALHRYFVQKHGWYVNGLDPAGGAWSGSLSTSLMKDRAPSYIQSLFERRLQGQGMGLHDLAVFAATLSDLIQSEAVGTLEEVYDALGLPAHGALTDVEFDMSLKQYLMTFLVGDNITADGAEDLEVLQEAIADIYPAWHETLLWAQDLHHTHELEQQSLRNPFVEHRMSFERSAAFVHELGHRFGTYQDLECRSLKEALLELEDPGTGRVPLPRFYGGGRQGGGWQFTESVGYLRNLGVLDETNPRRLTVVIPNYISSQSNCLTSSGFYTICCSNECEDLLGHVERAIAAPGASVARVAEVVSHLSSDTVQAPRNLSAPLLRRLDQIASLHDGEVQLHGRLFAQWMHHAFPRECAFPHAAGTTHPASPDEWMARHGAEGLDASEEEMRQHVLAAEVLAAAGKEQITRAGDLPWLHVEEIMGRPPPGSMTPAATLRFLFAVLLLASAIIGLAGTTKVAALDMTESSSPPLSEVEEEKGAARRRTTSKVQQAPEGFLV